MIPEKNNWLIRHKKHCLNLRLDNDLVKNKVIEASKIITGLSQGINTKILNMDFEIEKIIKKKLEVRLSNLNKISLLCSGGEDSMYLLMILVKDLKIKPKLLCYITKNNFSDIQRLKYISNDLGLEMHLYDRSNLDMRNAYAKFCESQKRAPNDIAQPVHNALYFKAIETHGSSIVIDGQFCDTVLLSNPQNHFLYWIENNPLIFRVLVRLLNYLPLSKENKIKSRLGQLQDLLKYSNFVEHIFHLINLKNFDNDLKFYTEDLIKQHGVQFTFSIFFFYCLLEIRERDKYLLCPNLFSPFDDFKLAILTNKNIGQVLGPFIKKKPIRNLCKKYYPKLFRFQNTLPFEIE
jgi:hypothetical protein